MSQFVNPIDVVLIGIVKFLGLLESVDEILVVFIGNNVLVLVKGEKRRDAVALRRDLVVWESLDALELLPSFYILIGFSLAGYLLIG